MSDTGRTANDSRVNTPVPQATLPRIRAVVDVFAGGAHSDDAVQKKARFSKRHLAYAVSAARMLGLVIDTATGLSLTPDGEELWRTPKGSEAEAEILSRCIHASEALENLAPGLLSANPPTLDDTAKRVRERGGLSLTTALHRARMLLKWRAVLVNRTMESARQRPAQNRGSMPVLHVQNSRRSRKHESSSAISLFWWGHKPPARACSCSGSNPPSIWVRSSPR